MIRLAFLYALAVGIVFCAMGSAVAEPVANYGVPVRFARDQPVIFKDFAIRYVGERRVMSPVYRPGFIYYDFEVRGQKGPQIVSWTSGTGVIDSASFSVDGQPYELELRGTVTQKEFLKDDEFVLWTAAEFQRALKRR